MVDDKDIMAVMKLLPKDAVYYFCQATTHRAIKAKDVFGMAQEVGLHGTYHSSVSQAYRNALSESAPTDFLFVGGSSYVVADLLSSLACAKAQSV